MVIKHLNNGDKKIIKNPAQYLPFLGGGGSLKILAELQKNISNS